MESCGGGDFAIIEKMICCFVAVVFFMFQFTSCSHSNLAIVVPLTFSRVIRPGTSPLGGHNLQN